MSSSPKYKHVEIALRNGIRSGLYPKGSRIPSENELACHFAVSRQTVRHAMTKLINDGLVEPRRGSGTYITCTTDFRPDTMNVAVLITYIDEYIFPAILRGIESVLSNNGYTTILMQSHNHVEEERRLLNQCLSKDIDGMIVEGSKTALPNPNTDLYELMSSKGIPVVFINGYYASMRDSIYVVADDYQGGEEATQYLLKRGYTRIAGIFKNDDIQGHLRYSGYLRALLNSGIGIRDTDVFWYSTETADKVINNDLLIALNTCNAVICYNDEIAFKVVGALVKCGKNVPEDCAVISFDNSSYSEISSVRITSMNHPKEKLGSIAAQKLIDLMNGSTQNSCTLPFTLVEKEST